MSLRQSSVVVVVRPDGKMLLIRRSRTDRWKPLHWNFPGGRVDLGEMPCVAAARELLEEAGISVSPNQLSLLMRFRDRTTGWWVNVYYVRLAYVPHPTSSDGEHDAFEWATLRSLPKPVIPGVHPIVRVLRKMS